MRAVIIGLIRGYQLVVSPWLPASCRYRPSCSEYALISVRRFGALRGSWLALRRLSRCHPFGSHGYDPVPEPEAAWGGEGPGALPGGSSTRAW